MSIYQKDKYKFSSNPALVAMGKDITRKQGQDLARVLLRA